MAKKVSKKAFSKFYFLLLVPVFFLGLSNCGGNGTSEQNTELPTSVEVSGTITTQFGSQSQMAGWFLVAQPQDKLFSQVAEIDSSGNFVFKNFMASRNQTFVLLSPDRLFSSVLAMESAEATAVRQFFKYKGQGFPALIHKGPVINFQTLDNLEVNSSFLAQASDGDGVPDGIKSVGLRMKTGIAPQFNDDDDGDGILDVLDGDSDGDGSLDVVKTGSNDLYFSEGVEYIGMQTQVEPQTGSSDKISLIFKTKLKAGVSPSSVSIRAPDSIFSDASTTQQDATTGELTTSNSWDKTLADDGLNNDGAANDKLFQKTVILGASKSLRARQVLFFQLNFGDGTVWEYPVTVPNITLGSVSTAFDQTTRVVSISGTPFDTFEDYSWSVTVFDATTGKRLFTSKLIAGTIKDYTIPEAIFTSGNSYTLQVTTQTPERLPGFPSYVVFSAKTASFSF